MRRWRWSWPPCLPRPTRSSGAARVIDGDTLAIGATRVRLFGIDAPESGQRCGGSGADWACGAIAAARLAALAGAAVRCSGDEHDRYGRLIAICSADGVDLGGRMVSEGLAWAYVRYSEVYVPDQAGARSRRVGLWRGEAEAPWDFRADGGSRRLGHGRCGVGGGARGGVPGQGQRLPGRRAHLPSAGGRVVCADADRPRKRGEAWYCDEAAARAAGFRRQRGAGG